MKRTLFLLMILLAVSFSYAIDIDHDAVAYLGQAIDYKVTIEPNEVKTLSIVNPEGTELLDWSINHKDLEYSYEARGNSFINTWTFIKPNTRRLTLTAKIQLNKVGENTLITYYKNGDEKIDQSVVVVLDEQLCGNRICDENEDLTCPTDCRKFELPKIPGWVLWAALIILVVVLVGVFIKLKYWY